MVHKLIWVVMTAFEHDSLLVGMLGEVDEGRLEIS